MFSKPLSGVYAVIIYILLVGLFLGFFNQRKPKPESIHYVKKSDNKIEVGLTTAPKKAINPKAKPKPKPKKHIKKKKVIKKKIAPKKKVVKKKIIKKKVVKKKVLPKKKIIKKKVVKKRVVKKKVVEEKKVVKKKIDMKKLFDSIEDSERDTKVAKESKITSSMKNVKNRDKGIINKYFAKVEETLYYWPALSQFGGERAEVWLKIEQSGSFVFKILKPSNNPDFNSGLIQYLKQLQRVGFARHQYKRPLEARVEFIAKE